jgi:uncharacterized protein
MLDDPLDFETPDVSRLPMFPLGSVLFPGLGLPLRIFEPRYRAMLAACLEGERRFGVVLIERGSEVGGGEVRMGVATVAEILETAEQPDGTIGVFAVGQERVQIVEWLPEQPYPAAIVMPTAIEGPADDDRVAMLIKKLRGTLARRAEANLASAPATIELSTDPTEALWQVCALVPATPLDDYALLRAPSPEARISLVETLIDASDEQVRFALS